MPSGISPTSARKLSKDCHRSQRRIPRPPQSGCVDPQRTLMLVQILYIRVRLSPCRGRLRPFNVLGRMAAPEGLTASSGLQPRPSRRPMTSAPMPVRRDHSEIVIVSPATVSGRSLVAPDGESSRAPSRPYFKRLWNVDMGTPAISHHSPIVFVTPSMVMSRLQV